MTAVGKRVADMKLIIRRGFFGLLSVICMIFIFVMSSRDAVVSTQDSQTIGRVIAGFWISDFDKMDGMQQQLIVDNLDFVVRKAAHATEFAVLTLFLIFTLGKEFVAVDRSIEEMARVRISSYKNAFFVSAIYAVSDEIHQIFVAGRACQLRDVLIDCLGALVMIILFEAICRRIVVFRNSRLY